MRIPLADLKMQYFYLKTEISAALNRVLAKGCYIYGEEVALFERDFADYCGARFAIGVASGTDALRLSLLACDIGPGDEVITTAFTFGATIESIIHTGATPVLVDIDPETCNLDPANIEQAITDRTKAILPVHLQGFPVDMDPICELARKYSLHVIEA